MKRILDPLDERILAELTANARIAHIELGAKINLSRNAVRQRIERLERDGAIQGYTVLLGESRRPEVVQCEVLSGEFDLMLRVNAATPERVHLVWKEIAAMSGVENTVTSFVLSAVF